MKSNALLALFAGPAALALVCAPSLTAQQATPGQPATPVHAAVAPSGGAQAGGSIATLLPADTILYVSIPDITAMRAGMKGSALGQIYLHDDMQNFLAGGLAMLDQGWGMVRGMAGGMGVPEEATHWDALKSLEAGFAMRGQKGLENPFDAEPEIYMAARLVMADGLSTQMMAMATPMLEAQGFEYIEGASGAILSMTPGEGMHGGPSVELRVEGAAMVLEVTMGSRGEGSLAALEGYQSARARVHADGAAVFAYADFNEVWDTVMAGLGSEEPEVASLLASVMGPIMTPMQSVAMASGWDGPTSFTSFSIDLADDPGALWQTGPADLSLLDYIPADATSFTVGDFSAANAWAQHFLSAIDQIGEVEVEEGMTLSAMVQAESEDLHAWLFGANRPELDAALTSFGTRTFSYGRSSGMASEDVMFTEVRDPAAVAGALEKLMPRLREALQIADAPFQLDLKRVRLRVEGADGQMETVAGPAYYSLNLGASMPQELSMIGLSFQPTIGVTADGWLAFSMARGPVRDALTKGVQKPEQNIRGNADVQAFLKRAGSGANSLTWNDPRPPMEAMLGMALGLAPMAADMVSQSGLPFDLNELPGIDVFIKPMRPTETISRMQGGNLVAESRGSFGLADVFTVCGALAAVAPVAMTVSGPMMMDTPGGEPEPIIEEF